MSTDAQPGQDTDVLAVLREYTLDCRYEETEALIRAELARAEGDPERTARLHVARGRLRLRQYEHRAALEEFAAALRHDPECGPAAGWRVAALDRMGRLDEALAEGTAAAARHPRSADVHTALGWLHHGSCRWDEALAAFEQATSVGPRHAEGWIGAAWTRVELGDTAAALRGLEDAEHALADPVEVRCAAVRIAASRGGGEPDHAKLLAARSLDRDDVAVLTAEVRYESGRGDARAALEAAERLAARYGRRPEAHVEHARCLIDLGRTDEAAEACDRALALEPHCDLAWECKAEAQRRGGDPAEALATGRRAARECPYAPGVRLELAAAELACGALDRALARTEEALALDPCSDWALGVRADLLRRGGDVDGATEAVRHAAALRPADPEALLRLSGALGAAGRYDEALAAVTRARELAPADTYLMERSLALLRGARRWDDTAEMIASLREADRTGRLEGLLLEEQACLSFARQRYARAVEECEAALLAEPERDFAARLRVRSLCGLGRLADAEAAARQGAGTAADDPEAHALLATVLFAAERTEEALAAVDRALRLDARSADAHVARLDGLRAAERWSEAEAALEEAVHRGVPADVVAAQRARTALGRDDHDRARAAAEEWLRLRPDDLEALELLATAHLGRGDLPAAESAARRAAAASPGSAAGLCLLAACFGEQERRTEECEAYEEALRREPDHRDALLGRLAVLRTLGRWDEAERAAEDAAGLRSDDPEVLTAVGWLYSAMERPGDGLPFARRAAELTDDASGAVDLLGWLLRRSRQWDEAEQVLRRGAERRPTAPDAHMDLAYCLWDQDKDTECLESVDRALALRPDRVRTLTFKVEVLCSLRRWNEAEAVARRARGGHPGIAAAHVATAQVLADTYRREEALPHLRRALQLDPEHEWACRLLIDTLAGLGRSEEAEQAAEALLGRVPDAVSVRCRLAAVLRERHRYDEALAQCERAVADAPYSVTAHDQLVTTLRECGSLDEAERHVEEFTRVRPHLTSLRFQLAAVHAERGDHIPAAQVLEELLESAPGPLGRAEARAATGWVALMDQRPLDAADAFAEVLRCRPHDHDFRLGRAWSLVRLADLGPGGPRSDGRLAEAAAHCRAVGREDPRNAAAHTCLGLIAHRRGEPAAAERHFARAVELDPYGRSHTELGALYVQLGRYTEAEAVLRRAVELDWYDVQAHVELGSLALHRAREGGGDVMTAEAAGEFRRAVAVDPDSGSAALGLAVALAEGAGDLGAAEEELRRVLGRRGVRDQPEWQLRLALARLLVQAGDAEQNADRHRDAGQEARAAIRLAEREAEPHFVAGVVEQRLGTQTVDVRLKLLHRRRAQRFLTRCRRLDPAHQDAERALRLLEEDARAARGSRLSSAVLVLVATVVLGAAWVDFLWKHHVTAVMLTTLTPVLAGLIAVGFLLPVLIRLKLPGGMEADLSASIGQISRGPRGEVALTPARTPAGNGPVGRMPRL
ncbi:tetratricopeptide repeat protein [Actinacidiphila glaucinigra]|uniref:tetratricopeptide repeat protein n=1 Tax=Actinacidiphila glaucinigra TaxID=235986 RepID=UPI002E328BDD|nr:tetratricopeptide repeat protein [Actinacidiphila glaucinigra]